MTFKTRLLATTFLIAATTGLASAQDARDLQISGVISLNGSGEIFTYRGDDAPWWMEGEGVNALPSISGKLGVVVSPEFTLQVDGWAQLDQGWGTGADYDYPSYPLDWNDLYIGGATHLTYHAGDYLIGVVGGLGHMRDLDDPEYSSTYASIGVEGGYDGDEFRIIGQAGLVRPVAGDAVGNFDGAIFAALTGTYYLTPDFSVSAYGTLSSNEYVGYSADKNLRATLGADVRYKLDDSPLILSLGYQAKFWDSEYVTLDNGIYSETNHRVTAGLHIPFGAGSSTLRDLDRTVGLSLEDPVYGIDGLR